MDTVLPRSLIEAEDFAALLVDQQERFSKRLLFAQGVLREALSWLEVQEGEFQEFADGLELDLVSAASIDLSDTKAQVSTWFVHSTWAFSVKAETLVALLSDDIKTQLDERLPTLSITTTEFSRWLLVELKAALSAFDSLRNSQAFDHALACLIAIDIFLGRLLIALYMWRLWAFH